MVKEMRIRFGRIDPPDDGLPTPGEIHERIDNEFRLRDKETVIEGEKPVKLEEKGMNTCHIDNHGDHSFCQFTYVADKENSATVREGDEVKDAPNNQPLNLRVFYFKNGQFAYEPRNELVDHWIPKFILSRTDRDVEIDDPFLGFSQETMREFYRDTDKITLFRFESPDETIDSSSSLVQGLDELAEKISSQEFSGGNPPEI